MKIREKFVRVGVAPKRQELGVEDGFRSKEGHGGYGQWASRLTIFPFKESTAFSKRGRCYIVTALKLVTGCINNGDGLTHDSVDTLYMTCDISESLVGE